LKNPVLFEKSSENLKWMRVISVQKESDEREEDERREKLQYFDF
jgi:hypothetical protein